MWTTRSPAREALEDVSGHDPAHRLRAADADVPEQLAVGDEDEAIRPAVEAAVQAPVDDGDGAGRRRDLDGVRDARRVAALLEELREPWGLVRGDHDAGARFGTPAVLAEPPIDGFGDARAASRREHGLAPPEQVA